MENDASQNAPETNLEGAAGAPASESAPVATALSVASEGAVRSVAYETLAQFAYRHNIPVNRVRELNPDGVDDNGVILYSPLRIE